MANLPNLQLIADAHALNIFGQGMSHAAVQLLNSSDNPSPEYETLKSSFNENVPKIEVIIGNLKAHFA